MKKEKQQFEIIYFELDSGECPVSEFIDLLEPKMKAKVFMEMALLEEPGNSLRFPYSEYLSEGIFLNLECYPAQILPETAVKPLASAMGI